MNESTRMGLTTRMSSLVPQSPAFAASGVRVETQHALVAVDQLPHLVPAEDAGGSPPRRRAHLRLPLEQRLNLLHLRRPRLQFDWHPRRRVHLNQTRLLSLFRASFNWRLEGEMYPSVLGSSLVSFMVISLVILWMRRHPDSRACLIQLRFEQGAWFPYPGASACRLSTLRSESTTL